MKYRVSSLLAPVLGTVLVACQAGGVPVPVIRPAEINLKGRNSLALGSFEGPKAAEYATELKRSIDGSKYLTLVEVGAREVARREALFAQSVESDGQGPTGGHLEAASILVKAQILEHAYSDNVRRYDSTCRKKEGGRTIKYKCPRYTRNGIARARVAFDLIDLETTRNIAPKRISCEKKKSTSSSNSQPRAIEGDVLLYQCVQEVVANFMKAISPWRDTVVLPLAEDDKLPQLKQGIVLAKAERWDDAVGQFASAVDAGSKGSVSPKTLAKAHLDLGLAQAVLHRFDEGLTHVRIAQELDPQEGYVRALNLVETMQREYEKLLEQTDAEGTEENTASSASP